jgi:hypothetical protein
MIFWLAILPSSLSSVVPCCSPLADGVGVNENFGGVTKLIDDLSVAIGLVKPGDVNVD